MQASILLFHGSTLEAVRRIESSAAGFTGLQFCPDGSRLLAATCDRCLLTYTTDGALTGHHALRDNRMSSILCPLNLSIFA